MAKASEILPAPNWICFEKPQLGEQREGARDGNQCGIRYTGDERVGSASMLIAGVDTPTFGVWQNGIPSALCGRIAKVYKDGQTYQFVVTDRIWENTSSAQLDVAKQFFYSVMGNNNWTANVEITSQVAPGITCDSWVFKHAVSKSYCTNSYGAASKDPQDDPQGKPASPSADQAIPGDPAVSRVSGGCQTDFSSQATPGPVGAMALLLWLLLRRRLHTPG